MEEKISKILKLVTLEEKASLCSGLNFWETKSIRRLDLPSICLADGPHGLRKENDDDDNVGLKSSFPATSFPPAVNLASTWNPQLAYELGVQLSEQCKNQNVQTILGPGTNIKRSPLCGRNFEYFSEDPLLAGEMCVSYINGVQSGGIGTSLKHFAANSQEYLRMTIDEIIDERALREIYLPQFEAAVKRAQPWTVMCSYNKLNGTHVSDNKKLLNDILRTEWGFEGLVVSDWNALNKRLLALEAGMDLEMPSCGGRTDRQIVTAIEKGELAIEVLDTTVTRILEFILKSKASICENYFVDYEQGHKIARKIADESIVLLKNDNDILPHSLDKEFTIIGSLAKKCRYQGSGSSQINAYRLVNILEYFDDHNIKYTFSEGYGLQDEKDDIRLLNEAITAAKTGKNILLFVGLPESYETEAIDRTHMKLPASHDVLAQAILGVDKNATVILTGGAPVEMPWLSECTTLLNAYLPGEAFGESVSDILFGKISPSGKLAETYPIKLEDNLVSKYYRCGPRTVEHRESIYIGYRFYDTAKKAVAFPFGHGLSYTKFEYSDLKVSKTDFSDNDSITVSATIKNIGKCDGAEVVQLYVKDSESTIFKAEKELRGFNKVFIKKGESAVVNFTLDKRSFAYYNTNICDWHVESGEYVICIASSSRDIRLSQAVNVTSSVEGVVVPDFKTSCPTYYNLNEATELPTQEFQALYGKDLPINRKLKRGEFDLNATIEELMCCIPGKITNKVAPLFIQGQMPNADMTTRLLMARSFREMPVRVLNGITSGLLDQRVPVGIVMWANKHRLKGLGQIIKGFLASLVNISKQNELRHAKQEKRQAREALKQQEKELKAQKEAQIKALKVDAKANQDENYNKADTKIAIKEAKADSKNSIKDLKVETKSAIKSINEDIKTMKVENSSKPKSKDGEGETKN